MQDGSILGDVDLVAAEHGLGARPQPGLLRQSNEQPKRLVGHPILGVVEVESRRLDGETLAALGVVREERPEMAIPDALVVCGERLPGRARRERRSDRGHGRRPKAFLTISWASLICFATTLCLF